MFGALCLLPAQRAYRQGWRNDVIPTETLEIIPELA